MMKETSADSLVQQLQLSGPALDIPRANCIQDHHLPRGMSQRTSLYVRLLYLGRCVPVIPTEHGERLWMDADASPEGVPSMLAPHPAELMGAFAVSTAVNRAERDFAKLIKLAET